jgi:hypothetical protein
VTTRHARLRAARPRQGRSLPVVRPRGRRSSMTLAFRAQRRCIAGMAMRPAATRKQVWRPPVRGSDTDATALLRPCGEAADRNARGVAPAGRPTRELGSLAGSASSACDCGSVRHDHPCLHGAELRRWRGRSPMASWQLTQPDRPGRHRVLFHCYRETSLSSRGRWWWEP